MGSIREAPADANEFGVVVERLVRGTMEKKIRDDGKERWKTDEVSETEEDVKWMTLHTADMYVFEHSGIVSHFLCCGNI